MVNEVHFTVLLSMVNYRFVSFEYSAEHVDDENILESLLSVVEKEFKVLFEVMEKMIDQRCL